MPPRYALWSNPVGGASLEQMVSEIREAMPPEERRWPPIVSLSVPLLRRRVHVDLPQVIAVATLAIVALGSVAGVWWFCVHGVTWFDVALFAFMTWGVGIGITLGYHRLFTHLAFQAKPWLRATLGIIGAAGMQGPITAWASIHRKHHRYSDRPGDPHSPVGRGGIVRGFIHSHVGWMVTGGYAIYTDYARDLWRDRLVAWVDRWYLLWVAAGWVVPGLVGWAWYGGWDGYWAGLFAGGPLRALVQLNLTWSVNSLTHLFGRQPFVTSDDSRNSTLVNVVSIIGEGLHNAHHAFPWSARFALRPGEIDTGYWVLRLFERLGWVWNVRIPTERLIRARLAGMPVAAERQSIP